MYSRIPANCNINNKKVKFKLALKISDNIIEFFNDNSLQILTELELNFTNVPFHLHGNGKSKNILQYLSNNANNIDLIIDFINYFIIEIANISYDSGQKLIYNLSKSQTWQTSKIRVFDPSKPNNYIPITTTSTTTLAPTTTTTTLAPTTTTTTLTPTTTTTTLAPTTTTTTLEPTTTTTTLAPTTTTTTLAPTTTTTTTIIDQYVVLISMDGARTGETLGTPSNIPNIMSLSMSGVTNTNFYTAVPSTTIPGHAAMVSGKFEAISNNGDQNPTYPSFMQEWLYNMNIISTGDTSQAKMIFSKDKLYCIRKASGTTLENYQPFINAGVNGDGTGGYRADSITHNLFKTECLGVTPSRISMVSYAEPDSYAHASDFTGYVNAITQTDTYIGEIWSLIQAHPLMANKTTLIITNDHGRATPNYQDHGGDSESELHVLFVAIGPKIKTNQIISTYRELIDIPSTILNIFNMNKLYNDGNIMSEIFKVETLFIHIPNLI